MSLPIFLLVILGVLLVTLIPIFCIPFQPQLAGSQILNLHEHFDTSIPFTEENPMSLHLTRGTLMPKAQAPIEAISFELPAITTRMSPVFDQGNLGS